MDVEWSDGSVTKDVKHPSSVYFIDTGQEKVLIDTGTSDLNRIRNS